MHARSSQIVMCVAQRRRRRLKSHNLAQSLAGARPLFIVCCLCMGLCVCAQQIYILYARILPQFKLKQSEPRQRRHDGAHQTLYTYIYINTTYKYQTSTSFCSVKNQSNYTNCARHLASPFSRDPRLSATQQNSNHRQNTTTHTQTQKSQSFCVLADNVCICVRVEFVYAYHTIFVICAFSLSCECLYAYVSHIITAAQQDAAGAQFDAFSPLTPPPPAPSTSSSVIQGIMLCSYINIYIYRILMV